MNSASYIEEAAFLSSASLIEKELTVFSNLSSSDLAILSAQNFAVYKPYTQSFYYKTETIFPLLHNAVVSELSHYRIEMVMPSSDLEAPIDIIYDK